jgi:hypothetical protein
VRETDDAIRPEGDGLRSLRIREQLIGSPVPEGARHDVPRRSLERRYEVEERANLIWKTCDAHANELAQRRRYRERLRTRNWLSLREQVGELEREHRIAARSHMKAPRGRPRESHRESRPHEVLQRPRAQPTDLELDERPSIDSFGEVERIRDAGPTTQRREHAERETTEPPQSERQHAPRSRVQPLHIIDRDQQWSPCRKQPQTSNDRSWKHETVACRPPRIFDAERGRDRSRLRPRELVSDLVERPLEKVAQPAESQRHLDLGTPNGKHSDSRRLRGGYDITPDRRLPEARLSPHKRKPLAVRQLLDEALQLPSLPLAANELEGTDRRTSDHEAIVADRQASS